MEHDWREIRGSYHAHDRVADFRCARPGCGAWIADRDPHHLPLDATDCPFPGNDLPAVEDAPPNPAGALRGLLPNEATEAARALQAQMSFYY